MTDVLHPETVELETGRTEIAAGLRGYILAVARTLGLGPESCALNPNYPARGYVAVNIELARFPGRDLALSWDERYGWSAVVESDFGQRITRVARLDGSTLPGPAEVQAFVDDLVAESPVRSRHPRAVLRRLRGHSAA